MVAGTMEEFCKQLPKIELHAHIHGSVRPSTLEELLQEQNAMATTSPELHVPKGRSMKECFEMFALIHRVIVSKRVLRRIVIETIEDFAQENCKYLELRSTPRELQQDGLSRAQYVEIVIQAIDECQARQDLDIDVRLLLSINRNQSVEIARETVQLALEWQQKRPDLIVGIDLSGQPNVPEAEFHLFQDILQQARQGELKLAVHFAEHFDAVEAQQVLEFMPERVGHACCLADQDYTQMVANRLPIEVCLTSNVHTLDKYKAFCEQCHPSKVMLPCLCAYKDHPHRQLIIGASDPEYPLCLCTDDTGVLGTSLANEYLSAAYAFGLTRSRLLTLARNSLLMIFDKSDKVQRRLVSFFDQAADSLNGHPGSSNN